MLEFKLPEVSDNVKSGTIVKINVSVGATIKKNQTLMEMETDKATVEVPSPIDGVVAAILVKEGQTVKIGQNIVNIEEKAGSAIPVASSKPAVEAPKSAPITSSKQETPAPVVNIAQPVVAVSTSKNLIDVPAAPSVRRFAREIGIDVSQVPGTGPRGRISVEDVKAFSKNLNSSRGSVGGGIVQQPLPDFTKWGTIERQAMNNIRKKTAEHMSYCWSTIPHVTQFDKADITELEKLRKKLSTDKRKLTITPFLLKVMASALKTFPQFNASVDMSRNEIILKKYLHIGVAVDTDRGLLVPIVRNVDQKSIFEIADELNAMAERARSRKTSLEELQGGSMTLTNLGGIGGTFFTPIVNSPEVAILGVSRGSMEPVYENGQFIPRLRLPLSLSYDHRVIDGADGARFLRYICEAIEHPFIMELEK